MFDIGWSEMALIMLVALIVIGPKDLPRVARTVGQWVGKGRALAREFQKQLEDMAREAELDKVKGEIEKAGRTDLKRSVERQIDPKGELKGAFKIDDDKASNGKGRTAGAGRTGASAKAAEPAPRANGATAPESGTGDRPEGGRVADDVAGPVTAREKAPTP